MGDTCHHCKGDMWHEMTSAGTMADMWQGYDVADTQADRLHGRLVVELEFDTWQTSVGC
jgi:hypothetical protein